MSGPTIAGLVERAMRWVAFGGRRDQSPSQERVPDHRNPALPFRQRSLKERKEWPSPR